MIVVRGEGKGKWAVGTMLSRNIGYESANPHPKTFFYNFCSKFYFEVGKFFTVMAKIKKIGVKFFSQKWVS